MAGPRQTPQAIPPLTRGLRPRGPEMHAGYGMPEPPRTASSPQAEGWARAPRRPEVQPDPRADWARGGAAGYGAGDSDPFASHAGYSGAPYSADPEYDDAYYGAAMAQSAYPAATPPRRPQQAYQQAAPQYQRPQPEPIAEDVWWPEDGPAARAAPPAQGGSMAMDAMRIAGGLSSLALIVGLSIWGYSTVMRDVAGVPVIQALGGPMREEPEDPEGTRAANQGLTINAVQAEGRTGAVPDVIALAPAPVDLEADARAAASLAPQSNSSTAGITAPAPLGAAPATGPGTPVTTDYSALADELTREATPLGEEITGAEDTVAVIPAGVPGVSSSPRPPQRPVTLRVSPASADVRLASTGTVASAAPPAAGSTFVDGADLPVGTRLAQFGAYETVEQAVAQWTVLQERFGAYFEGKTPVIEEATAGGRLFQRLRVMGFNSVSETRQFCAVFTAQSVDCIPATAK